jgi:molecular chaperone GrpE
MRGSLLPSAAMPDDPAGEPDEVPPAPAPEGAEAAKPSEEWESRFKYLLADFENFRRRAERERETVTRQARGAVLRDLLPIAEAFRAAVASRDHLPSSDPLRRGMELLDREWQKFLKHQGVEPVAEVGHPFRAEEAEAVGETAPSDGAPAGSVAEVVQQGYRYFGGLLRPAKVIVARAAPAPATEEPPAPAGSSEESDA